jgi:outer membrane lipoprotein-sorting protein
VRISEPRRALSVALTLFLLSGCAATSSAPRQPTPTGSAPTLRRVLDVLDARDRALSRFRAQARLDYKSPEQSFRSTQVVVVRAPSSARIDVMNPFGVSYTVATDGTQISAYDRRKSVFYTGQAQPDSFRHFTGIPMQASELSSVLRGLPPNLGESRWSPTVEATEGGWLLRRRLSTGGTLQLVVQAASFVPLRVKISGDRQRRDVEIVYDDYRDIGGAWVPHRIQVTFRDGTHLDLVYKSVQRDVALTDDAYQIERPAGARCVDGDAGGVPNAAM